MLSSKVESQSGMNAFIVEKKLGKYSLNHLIIVSSLLTFNFVCSGEGSFSEVYRVKRKSDGAVYAMKKVKMGKLSAKEKDNSLNEVRILASINHPNVIGYKEAFFEDATNTLNVVMEFADGGDLLMKINNHKKLNTNFTEKEVWHFFI